MAICYENAQIFTGDQQSADCFVVQDGVFAFVGSKKDGIAAFPDAQHIDLNGQFVCPGFNDSHMHLLELGCTLTQAQLNLCTDSLADVLRGVSAFAQANPDESWILGRGWNHDFFTDQTRYPNRYDLDSVCPDRPCLITRACGHVAVANSCALALAGIDSSATVISGGCIQVDDAKKPTGILEENAIQLVSSLIPAPDREGIKRRLILAMETVAQYGITSVQTDDFCALETPFEEVIAAYLELKAEGRLTVRITEQCLLPTMDALERFLSKGYCSGWGDDLFRLGPLKLLADGSLGARTAYLNAPYADAPDTQGTAIYPQDDLEALVLRAHQAGMQIAVHAIGDAAADRVLAAIEKAQQIHPREDARHGIVHAQILTKEQIKRMQALHMHAYIQSIFLDYDTQIVFPRLGERRALDAYPARSFLSTGVSFSGGSDCPVEPCDVLKGIQCAVTRKSISHPSNTPYLLHEALTLHEALLSFTHWGAYASFEEERKGLIANGMLADFTVLGIDPFETDPIFIHRIPVRHTYMGGVQVR